MRRMPLDGLHAFGVFLAWVSAAAIFFAGHTLSWFRGLLDGWSPDADLGPRGLRVCAGCETHAFGWHDFFTVVANLTHVGSIVCVLALVAASAIALLRPGVHRGGPGYVAFASSLAFLVLSAMFVGANPFDVTIGPGFLVAIVGSMGGMAAGILLARRPVRRPFRP